MIYQKNSMACRATITALGDLVADIMFDATD